MTGEQVATLIVAVLGVAGVIYGAWSARRNRREQEGHDDRAPGRPSVQEVWQRQDQIEAKYEARNAALVNVLYALADQWPADAPAPVFDDDDLKELAKTMPPQWRRRLRRPAST